MASGSFFIQHSLFIQCREDALRHLNLLAKGLKKVAQAGLVGGVASSFMALFLGHVLDPHGQSNAVPGATEMSGITFVSWFIAIALLVFSSLYLVAGWGLSQQKSWARYTAAAVFIGKILLCVWLGRGSVPAMIVFLLIAALDIYGLWVLLSKETGHLFSSSEISQPNIKPANLVT
jgi:hypothetical protein